MNKQQHNLTLRYALALIISLASVLGHARPMSAESAETNAPVPLTARHPDAGIWFMYPWGNNSLADLQKPYIKGAMAYARWRVLYTGPNTYNWYALNKELDLIVNQAGKKAMVEVTAGYCPDLEWPGWLRERVAARKTANSMGCYPLQFWDPVYIDYYKTYIKALATRLAQFDSTDARPRETDITFVRAQAMADTMENIPNDNQMGNWEWQDFNPAPNGRIYKVNLTNSIKYAYHETIVLAYQQELNRAYAAVGLRAPAASARAASYWSMYPSSSQFITQGVWLDQHNAAPNPQGWHYDMYNNVKSGATRGTVETGVKAPTSLLAQYNYWEVLAALHFGVEFIGIYSKNKYSPSLQPKGPVNYPENWESLNFATRYAGHLRNPGASPGAWIALRGGYPEDNFGGMIYPRRTWTNYEFLITQYRPQDSLAIYSNSGEGKDQILPNVKRLTKLPWGDEVTICKKSNPAHLCDQISSPPTQYLRFANSYHEYTYGSNDLGKVIYCGTDMFCTNPANATRTETILWAERTNAAGGGSAYMRFNVNDTFAQSLGGKAHIRVVYLDQGTGKWELRYDSTAGADKSAVVIQKGNTMQWKEVIVNLQDVAFSNRQEGGTDIALYNKGDDDDTFHMVEVVRYGGLTAAGEEAAPDETPVDQGPPTGGEEALPPDEQPSEDQETPFDNTLLLPNIVR